jgi:hypothetical protein
MKAVVFEVRTTTLKLPEGLYVLNFLKNERNFYLF